MLLSAPPLILLIMQEITYLNTSFPVIHKVVLLQFKNKSDTVISHINFSSKEHDKCEFEYVIIQLVTMSTLPSLCIMEKLGYQYSNLWLRDSLNVKKM